MKIHISSATATRLNSQGDFRTQLRGDIDMKVSWPVVMLLTEVWSGQGKGVMTTYWLLGENRERPGDMISNSAGSDCHSKCDSPSIWATSLLRYLQVTECGEWRGPPARTGWWWCWQCPREFYFNCREKIPKFHLLSLRPIMSSEILVCTNPLLCMPQVESPSQFTASCSIEPAPSTNFIVLLHTGKHTEMYLKNMNKRNL